jgi:serine acetyltransferase
MTHPPALTTRIGVVCRAVRGRPLMVLEVLWRLIAPACTVYALLRYRNIWGIREVLHAAPDSHPVLARVYKDHLARKGSWIGYRARIDGIPIFPHDMLGVFISDNCVIGKNCVIFQHVTIGSETRQDSQFRGSPVIGDNVYIGAGAKIIGGIRVGDNCRIGANVALTGHVPANTLVASARPRMIRMEPRAAAAPNS